jgi:hypothetical protein
LVGAGFSLLFLELVKFCHFKAQVYCLPVLDSSRASQQDVWEEAVVLAVLGLAVGEAGETAKSPPVSGAGVRAISLRESLGNEGRQRGRIQVIVFQPGLEVARAGFNHGARLKAVASEPGNRIRIQVVEDGEAVFTRWPDIDVRSACIVGLEEREP